MDGIWNNQDQLYKGWLLAVYIKKIDLKLKACKGIQWTGFPSSMNDVHHHAMKQIMKYRFSGGVGGVLSVLHPNWFLQLTLVTVPSVSGQGLRDATGLPCVGDEDVLVYAAVKQGSGSGPWGGKYVYIYIYVNIVCMYIYIIYTAHQYVHAVGEFVKKSF